MKWLHFLGVLALVAGCRRDFGDAPGQHIDAPLGSVIDAHTGPDSPPGALTTIKALRQNPPGPDEVVEVKSVIVVARVRSSTRVNFWVQDQGGGEFSGIQVFCPKNGCTQYDELSTLERGEVLDISGEYTVFLGEPELSFVTVTKKGTTMAPTFVTVPASEVASTTDTTSAAFQKWIGAAARIEGPADVTDITVDAFKSTCPTGGSGDFYDGVQTMVGGTSVYVGLSFFNQLEFCLANPCGITCDRPIMEGADFSQLQGIVRATDGTVSIDPSLPTDLGGTSTAADAGPMVDAAPRPDAAPAVDAAPAIDATPMTADSPPVTHGPIYNLLQDPPADGTVVTLNGVVVVGYRLNGTTPTRSVNLYVQDPGGGLFSGMQVFCREATDLACLNSVIANGSAGTVVNVTGPYLPFSTNVGGTPVLTPEIQFSNATSPIVTLGIGTIEPVALVLPAASVANDFPVTSPEFQSYNQVLVKVIGPATVATVSANNFDATVGAKTIFADIAGFVAVTWCGTASCGANEIHVNDVFSSMTGLIRIASQKIQFAITKDADLVRQ